MIAARKEADIKYQAFLDNDKVDVNFAKLEYVYKSYISLLDRIESISKLMGERQFLTELHFIGPIFPLNAHEKYHEISDRIQAVCRRTSRCAPKCSARWMARAKISQVRVAA